MPSASATVTASAMTYEDINYIFTIWCDCYSLDSFIFVDASRLRCINKFFNNTFKSYYTCTTIYKELRFELMYDAINRHAGSIYGITHYTENVAYFVKKYIDFCKYIINYRPIRMVKDIIHIIKLSWLTDIIPYNQVYGDYFDISCILSGIEKFDFKHKQHITHELALEIFEYIFRFRYEGFIYNKNKQQLELERNEIAVMHNNRIVTWKRYTRSNSQMSPCYKNWIHSEQKSKHLDWTYRSTNIRHGEFVAKMEHYFKNHPVSV